MSRSCSHLANCAFRLFLLAAVVFLMSGGLRAQNYSWDARSVGMGGETGFGADNLAATLVPAERNYTAIMVPMGFVQLFRNLDAFNPSNANFDALRAIDYVGNPFHYSFNRSEKAGAIDFLKNIVDS